MADAGRVIAGTARGIRLRAAGEETRPLGDRVKQTLFAILEPDLPDARVLDLFAGSGAAGIEALSRGATRVVFIEKDAIATRTIGENLARAHVAGPRAIVLRRDVLRYLEEGAVADGPFGVVIVDPPYIETDLLARAVAALGGSEAPLTPDARVVVKHFWRDRQPERVGMLAVERDRRFGETALTFYRRRVQQAGDAPDDGEDR